MRLDAEKTISAVRPFPYPTSFFHFSLSAVRRQLGGGPGGGPGTASRKRRGADREKWKKDVGYGKGRTVEIVFSASRRMFGDCPYSKKWDNMVREVRIRAAAYNRWVVRV